MIVEVDDEYANYLINAIDALIKVYDQYSYTIHDIPKIASLGIYFNNCAKKAVKEYVDPEEKFNKEHPEFIRGPNPDEHQVLGRGYVKNDEKNDKK